MSTDDEQAPPGTKRVSPGHEVSVVDADGKELPYGEVGDIAVLGRPPTLFAGYWNAAKGRGAAFRGEWFITGDRGSRDADGHLSVVNSPRQAIQFTNEPRDSLEEPIQPTSDVDDKEWAAGKERAATASNEHLYVGPDNATPRAARPGPSPSDSTTYSYPLQSESEDADRVGTQMTSTNSPISSFRAEQSGSVRLLTALKRHWVLITALVGIAVGVTFVAVHIAEKRYEATADILVTPLAPDDNTFRGFSLIRATYGDSAPVVTAARILGSAAISRPALASLGALADRGSVEVKPLGQVSTVSIVGKAASADDATNIANGFAKNALAARNAEFQRELRKQIRRLTARAAAIPASTREGNFQYASLQQAIAELTQDIGSADPTLRLLTFAETPYAPVWPRPVFSLVSAFFVALLLGCGIAALLEFASPRVTSEDDLLVGHRLPILARIPRLPDRAMRGFLSGRADMPYGAWKGYRTLRAVLETLGADGAYPRSVLITSASPGDGKTTTAVNLAITLAAASNRVILIDGDVHRPSVATIFNTPAGRDGLARLLAKRAAPESALISAPAHPHLQLLLSSPGGNGVNITGERFRQMLDELSNYADVIVIDAPPVTEVAEVLTMAAATECVLVAVRLGHTQREKLAELREMLQQNRISPTGFVVTTRKRLREGSEYEYSGEQYPSAEPNTKPATVPAAAPTVGRRGSAIRGVR